MPKIKQTLKSQLTLRIYNQEDKDILDKAKEALEEFWQYARDAGEI